MDPKVSIIVPVFNVENYIDKCIESILNQTLKDFELILVNDGSTDKSGLICDQYSKRDSRIKVIHKKNGGPSTARNIGLNIARGEYVGFVDSDDWIDPDMYNTLFNSSTKNKSDMVISGIREINETGKILNEYIPNSTSLSDILKRAYPCNKLFKKKLFVENNFFFVEGKYYEDLELIPKLFIKSEKITIVNKAFYNYLKRTGSTTSSRDEKILDNIWAYIQIKKFLIKEHLYVEHKEEFEKGVRYFKRYFISIIYDYPSGFLLRNLPKIFKGFNNLGGLNMINYSELLLMHMIYSMRRLGYKTKIKLGKLFI